MERHTNKLEDLLCQSSGFEVLAVTDPHHASPHYLLVEWESERHQSIRPAESRYLVSRIEVRAWYLYGPNVGRIGRLVTRMGGDLQWADNVRLTNGEVMIKLPELQGLHIGTYVFSRIVAWAKTLDQDIHIQPIRLAVGDARDERNRQRRNRFYENFGLRFAYHEKEEIPHAEGMSLASLQLRDLVPYENWPNIRPTHSLDAFKELAHAFRVNQQKLRQSYRLALYYRRKANRIDEILSRIARRSRSLLRLPVWTAIAFIGYQVGRIWPDLLSQYLLVWLHT